MATRTITRYRNRPKRKTRSRAGFTLPLGVVAGIAPTAAFALEGFRIGGDQGGITEAAHRLTMRLTGYEWKGQLWSWQELLKGWTPLLAGIVAHKAANRLGINRALSRMGVPILRI